MMMTLKYFSKLRKSPASPRIRSVVTGNWLAMCLIALFSLFGQPDFAQTKGQFTDPRDGRVYRTITAGDQVWMTKNIMFDLPGHSWAYNGDDSVHVPKYGRLYDWSGAREACPKGWKLPSLKDWQKLIHHLGPDTAGLVIMAWDTIGAVWPSGNRPVIPVIPGVLGGVRYANGSFLNVTYWGGCWTSTSVNDSTAVNVLFVRKSGTVGESTNDKKAGFSVRCFKK